MSAILDRVYSCLFLFSSVLHLLQDTSWIDCSIHKSLRVLQPSSVVANPASSFGIHLHLPDSISYKPLWAIPDCLPRITDLPEAGPEGEHLLLLLLGAVVVLAYVKNDEEEYWQV